MGYDKNDPAWVDDSTALAADRLNHLETQYDEAVTVANTVTGADYAASGRALDTIYQNTSGKPLWVIVTTNVGNNIGVTAYIGAASPPTSAVAKNFTSGGSTGFIPMTFLVPPSYYYKVTKTGSPTKQYWYEWTLH